MNVFLDALFCGAYYLFVGSFSFWQEQAESVNYLDNLQNLRLKDSENVIKSGSTENMSIRMTCESQQNPPDW